MTVRELELECENLQLRIAVAQTNRALAEAHLEMLPAQLTVKMEELKRMKEKDNA